VRPGIFRAVIASDYVPRRCGVATFTHHLRTALAEELPDADLLVAAVTDLEEGYRYPPEVRFQWSENDLDSYRRAADFINFARADVVSLQHEFGIYGGNAGSHILALLGDIQAPVVTTLHTILTNPDSDQRRVMDGLIEGSARLVVMAERGRAILRDVYSVPDEKVDMIPHGIPDMPFGDPNFYKDEFGVEGRLVALTFGLLSANKGIEYVIEAMPPIVEQFPNFVYIVLGATHPNVLRHEGESYRRKLERTARDLGLERHIVFYNRFVDEQELNEFIGAADLYITPYLNEAQITSGTLSYSFGCGKAVVSTPYWHAAELLADGRGAIVPFADSGAIAETVIELLRDEPRRHAMRKRAYLLGRKMIWPEVANRYLDVFAEARRTRLHTIPSLLESWTLDERPLELPQIRLDYLERLTDDTGVLQHATYNVPRFDEGYTTDDNARALQLIVELGRAGHRTAGVKRLAGVYASFLQHAYDPDVRRFRNVLTYERSWEDDDGSDDTLGRALRTLGACVRFPRWLNLQGWAVELFDHAIASVLDVSSPRAWAAALLGMDDYLHQLGGARVVEDAFAQLTENLLKRHAAAADDGWPWFEDVVSYDNALLPHALIIAGDRLGDEEIRRTGLDSLRWLADLQRVDHSHFRPIGSNGFYRRGGAPARFDQQPLEAQAMTSACLAAHRITGVETWLTEARRAFEWFLGRNDLGLELYDASSGGCHDGLHQDRVNENMGAESTLAFLQALVEMREASIGYDSAQTA
jgi:glycosyltransferase involved in cell wall biosynthesis